MVNFLTSTMLSPAVRVVSLTVFLARQRNVAKGGGFLDLPLAKEKRFSILISIVVVVAIPFRAMRQVPFLVAPMMLDPGLRV